MSNLKDLTWEHHKYAERQEFVKVLNDIVAQNLSTSIESNGSKMVSVQLAGDALSKACANLSNRLAEITSLNNYTE